MRIERDYTGGELPQFMPTYPLELEGRVSDFDLALFRRSLGSVQRRAWLQADEL